MSCFVCHSAVNYYISDSVREKYREVIGFNLCPDSHLCYICCHLISKLWNFKSICLKRCLEFPMLFRDKGSLNLQISDTDIQTICQEDLCKLSEYKNLKNTKIYNNFEHSNCTEDFTHKYSENSNQYVDLHQDYNLEANSEIAKDLNQRIDLAIPSIKNDIYNYEPSPLSNYNKNEHEHNSQDDINQCDVQSNTENDSSSLNEQVSNDDIDEQIEGFDSNDYNEKVNEESQTSDYGQNEQSQNSVSEQTININKQSQNSNCEQSINTNEQSMHSINTNEQSQNRNEQQEPDLEINKRNKKKKIKKQSFRKILLSFEEQKANLESARKEKKYLESEYKCYSCALGFLFKDTYQSHMVRHEESNGQFCCTVCGLRFATQNAKCMHVILHSELYKCNKCKSMIKRPHRSRHIRSCWKGAAEVASCHLCGKSFSDVNYLQQHLKRYHAAKTSSKVYSCTVCAKIYKDQAGVRTHMLKHLNARFSCTECSSSFTSPYTLNEHMKSHRQPSGTYTCVACDKHYTRLKYLNAHLRNAAVHRTDGVTCESCRRPFPPSSYPRHVCVPPSRTCASCGHVAPSRHALTRHMARHLPAPHGAVCHYCGNRYQNTSKLNRHLKEVCERVKMEEQLAELYEQQL